MVVVVLLVYIVIFTVQKVETVMFVSSSVTHADDDDKLSYNNGIG